MRGPLASHQALIPAHLEDSAVAELLAITRYLATLGVRRAEEFVAIFWSVVEDLRAFPALGQHIAGDKRVLRRGVYRFVYQLRDEDVLILRILDGRGQHDLP